MTSVAHRPNLTDEIFGRSTSTSLALISTDFHVDHTEPNAALTDDMT